MSFLIRRSLFFTCFWMGILSLNAQITTPYKTENLTDSIQTQKPLDSLRNEYVMDLNMPDSLYIDPVITIRKSLLDSLLNPFYTTIVDTVQKDTAYFAKYRMRIREVSGDTIFVPLPKAEKYLITKRRIKFHEIPIAKPVPEEDVDRLTKLNAPVWWKNENTITLAINESAFVNWNAGGNNSIAGVVNVAIIRKYQKLFTLWNNEIFLNYGLNQNEERGLRKTDDNIQLNSTFGYRRDTLSNWYYTAKLNFKTQFTNGYKYPNTEDPISKFFAPAYLFFGAGTEYNLKKEKLSVYISPVTFKSTFVFDDDLSNDGAFGVDPGKRSRIEFGFFTESSWEKKVMKNVIMINRLGLYTDYINNFGNIDVNWMVDFQFKVNKWIKANLGTHLIYDDDIKYKEDTNGDGNLETLGPRIQFKQVLNIGFSLSF